MGLPLLLGVVAIPYLFQHIGIERVGILTLVWALIGYFSLFDFGLGRALTQQVAAGLAERQQESLPALIKSGLLFTAATGLVGCVVLAVLAYPLAYRWLNVSQPLQESAFYALMIAALGIPMTTITTGLRGVLEAYEDFRAVNILRLILGMANFGFPVLCVMLFGPSLVYMIAGLIAARLVLLVAHWILLDRRLPHGWQKASFSKEKLRALFSFGAWMTVSNIIGPLMVTADRFIISSILGASVVAYYTVPSEMLVRVLILPAALTAVLFPRLASVIVSDSQAAGRLYRKCLKWVVIVLSPVCLAITLGSHWGLSLWLGQLFADQAWLIVAIMACGVLLNGIAFVPFAAVQAAGHADVTAKIHLAELIIYLPLLVFALYRFGLVGAALTWSARVAVDMVALLFVANRFGFRMQPRPAERTPTR